MPNVAGQRTNRSSLVRFLPSRVFLFVYAIISLMHLGSIFLSASKFVFWTKPLLMLPLFAYILTNPLLETSLSIWPLSGIFFSWLGDLFLLWPDNPDMFMFGLSAFLIAHLLYAFSFVKFSAQSESGQYEFVRLVLYALVCVYTFFLLINLYPVLGADLFLPVIMYALVITIMALTASYRYKRTSTGSFLLVFLGAVTFVLSDSLIAINKFLVGIPSGQFGIMFTYLLAQLVIIRGLIQHRTAVISRNFLQIN